MAKSEFASAIISKMKGAIGVGNYNTGSASSANKAIAEAITEYVLQNTIVTSTYVGVMPNGSKDPLSVDTFKVIGKCEPAPVSSNFDAWLAILRDNIANGFSIAVGGAGLIFSAKPFNPNTKIEITRDTDLKPIAEINGDSVQQITWERICNGILKWINGTPNPAAVGAASHAPSTGVATVSVVSVT